MNSVAQEEMIEQQEILGHRLDSLFLSHIRRARSTGKKSSSSAGDIRERIENAVGCRRPVDHRDGHHLGVKCQA